MLNAVRSPPNLLKPLAFERRQSNNARRFFKFPLCAAGVESVVKRSKDRVSILRPSIKSKEAYPNCPAQPAAPVIAAGNKTVVQVLYISVTINGAVLIRVKKV